MKRRFTQDSEHLINDELASRYNKNEDLCILDKKIFKKSATLSHQEKQSFCSSFYIRSYTSPKYHIYKFNVSKLSAENDQNNALQISCNNKRNSYSPSSEIMHDISSYHDEMFYKAVDEENFLLLNSLLRHKTDISTKLDYFKKITMGYAIKHNKIPIVQYLLGKAIKIPPDVDISSLQNTLVILNDYNSLNKIGPQLQLNKMDINGSGDAPLHIAISYNNIDMTRFLLNKKANVNFPNISGNTPMHIAAAVGNAQIIKILLANKANINIKNSKKLSVIELAYKISPLIILPLIRQLQYEYINSVVQKKMQKDLIRATVRQDIESVKALLYLTEIDNIRDVFGSVSRISIEYGNLNLIRLFSHKFANPKRFLEIVNNNKTLLMHAVHHQKHDIICFLTQNIKPVLQNPKDITGLNDLLHTAVKNKQVTLIDVLLNQGAQVDSKDNSGKTPLHYASEINDVEMLQLLLLYQANPNSLDQLHKTPLHIADENNYIEIVKLLLGATNDLNCENDCDNMDSPNYDISDIEKIWYEQINDPTISSLFGEEESDESDDPTISSLFDEENSDFLYEFYQHLDEDM